MSNQDSYKVQCKYCNQQALKWEQVNGHWKLVNHHGEVHHCQRTRESGSFFNEKGEKDA